MKFDPVYTPTDAAGLLSIHDDPPGLWSRVAVVCMWQDAKIARKRWPHASVVGPLRTVAGIDLLVRNLLNNPQIRVVVVDGPTAGVVGETTLKALTDVWIGRLAALGVDVHDHMRSLTGSIELLDAKVLADWAKDNPQGDDVWFEHADRDDYALVQVPDEDRSAYACGRFPPPAPKANAPAPHGDPGERIVGDTLAEVWPLTLHRIMRFGREVPTQYGMTREAWNLVSVVREPWRSLRDIENAYRDVYPAKGKTIPIEIKNGEAHAVAHPVLGLSFAQVQAYYKNELTGAVAPEGQSYGYGSRMAGGCERPHVATRGGMGAELLWHADGTRCYGGSAPDQIAAVERLLTEKPDTRAAYLSPWRPDEDGGKESGRPCLVGVLFRAVPGVMVCPAGHQSVETTKGVCGTCQRSACVAVLTLHMTVWFRSHDYGSAYNLNLAGCCMWLCELADKLGMAVGTVTCVSSSAHVYDRDWNKANAVIDAIKWPAIRWDARSSWRIEKVEGSRQGVLCNYIGPQGRVCGSPAVCSDVGDQPKEYRCSSHAGDLIYARAITILRATAFTPGPDSDGKVIAVIEAETPGALRLAIERSGLVTEIGAAMFLGYEIARVWEGK